MIDIRIFFRQEDLYVISGIGTIFLEIVEQIENIDAILLPIGGGSLLAAACVVIKSLFPQIKVIVSNKMTISPQKYQQHNNFSYAISKNVAPAWTQNI